MRARQGAELTTGECRAAALLIGYGNAMRGDDGIGHAVAAALAGERSDDYEVVDCHQLTPELAERLAAVELAVFIDAAADLPPGHVQVIETRHSRPQASSVTHHLDPAAILYLSDRLFGRAPRAWSVTIGAGSMTLGEGLSAPVAAALPRVIELARQLIAEAR